MLVVTITRLKSLSSDYTKELWREHPYRWNRFQSSWQSSDANLCTRKLEDETVLFFCRVILKINNAFSFHLPQVTSGDMIMTEAQIFYDRVLWPALPRRIANANGGKAGLSLGWQKTGSSKSDPVREQKTKSCRGKASWTLMQGVQPCTDWCQGNLPDLHTSQRLSSTSQSGWDG